MRRFGFHLMICAMMLALSLSAAPANSPPLPPSPAVTRARLNHLSPVEYFRGLLGMTAAERDRVLASRSEADRKIILAKLQEYEAMPREMREARLCQTELHWEMGALMKLAPAERPARLREVSPLYRPMIQTLLKQWDEVPADTQKSLLEKQDFIGLYLRMQGSPAPAQKEILDKLPPERRARWAGEMDRWQALSEDQRKDLCAQFQRFCLMNGEEQKDAVSPLSEPERKAMEGALRAFDRLPPAQRSRCIDSFRKFATMGAEERNQFLNNAARWQVMTSHERQLWRQLVRTLPPMPPMPPGLSGRIPPMPRLPERFRGNVAQSLRPPLPPNVTAPVIMALSTNEFR